MMSTAISPATALPVPANVKKMASVRSGADLTPPTMVVPTTVVQDAFTPLAGATTTTLDAAGNPVVLAADPAPSASAKSAFDPIALAIGVAGTGLAALLLGLFAKGKNDAAPEMGKVFLATGIGAGVAFAAPFGSNLVKDLLKKKSETPAAPEATVPAVAMPTASQLEATVAVATPPQGISVQTTTNNMPNLVPPAIDPTTGLPVVATPTYNTVAMPMVG